ncbi:MAG: hypothetical protein WAX89_01865 [Alphaproteobacteria bacterium]
MAPKKPVKPLKPAPKKITPPALPAMAAMAKKGECGVDGYCCQGKSAADCCGGTCGGSCGCKGTLFGCHLADLFTNVKAWVSLVVAFLAVWLFDIMWHGHMLMDRYTETAYLWRPEAEMHTLWPWCFVYHGLLALAFTASYLLMNAKTYVQGAKNGALIMAPLAISTIMVFMTQTIPTDILHMWAAGHLLQGVVAGLALTAVGHWFCARNGQCSI